MDSFQNWHDPFKGYGLIFIWGNPCFSKFRKGLWWSMILPITHLVGGSNPFEKYKSKRESSPNRFENKTYLKPPPSHWAKGTRISSRSSSASGWEQFVSQWKASQHPPENERIHPWKLTWNWKIPIFNRKYIFKCGCSIAMLVFDCFRGVDDTQNIWRQLLSRRRVTVSRCHRFGYLFQKFMGV